jgi:hypothetical protein
MEKMANPLRVLGLAAALLTVATVATPAQESAPDAIDIRWVMAGRETNGEPARYFNVPPKARLRTGDKLKMYFETRRRCFFYLFHQGPDGRVTLLYPPELPTEALAGGTRLTIPLGNQWFELDRQTGTESFYVLVSPTPLRTIEALYADYRKHGNDKGASASRLLSAIGRLRHQSRPLASSAERPLSIGGTIRGAPGKESMTTANRLEQLAEAISAPQVFCRTYTIEHY